MKYGTVAFDSASDQCRLYFSQSIGKHSDLKGSEMIRSMNHYPGATERLNMLARRVKNLKAQGTEVVFLAHEQIEKIWAKKGGLNEEPAAIKGLPDMPGNRTPEEICRAADNILRVRRLNNGAEAIWVAAREALQGDIYWETKVRFNAVIPELMNGLLPGSYEKLDAKIKSLKIDVNWHPPYVWVLYGIFGIGKTRSLCSFPGPIRLFDFDRGSDVLMGVRKDLGNQITELTTSTGKVLHITQYDVEECNEYPRFMGDLEVCFL
jgi:hypothetical protein